MAATDLDPIFVKALRLLHSKSKDSAAQLKAMLDEAIAQRKGLKVPAQSGDAGKLSPARIKPEDDYKRKDSEKRLHEKSIKDSSEPDIKKSKLDSKHRSKDEKEARDKERDKEKARRDREKKEREEKEAQRQKEKAEKEKRDRSLKQGNEITILSDDEESTSQLDAGDFALEMGIACVVCKQFGVSSGNQLVECQECHSLYHQECHKPPVSEETVNDPRNVWYCSRCQKMLQKKQQQVSQKSVPKPSKPSGSSLLGKDSSSALATSNKSFKPDSTSGTSGTSGSTSQAFRKIDPKVMAPPKDGVGQPKPLGLGLAGLAANLTKPQAKSGSSHRKTDATGKVSKSDGSFKPPSSSTFTLFSKTKPDEKRSDKQGMPASEKDRKSESGSSHSSKNTGSSNREDKKYGNGESSSKSSSSSSSEKKHSESSSKSEKKSHSDMVKSSSSSASGGLKLDIASATSKTSSQGLPTPDVPESPSNMSAKAGSSTSSGSSSVDKNKKAMATLSQITANKRMQMMMKKAQSKPSEKKVHIK